MPWVGDRPAIVRLLFSLLLMATVGNYAHAQTVKASASVAHGEHIAQNVCSACHVVAKGQEFPPLLNQPAPSFFDIANRPGVSAESLRHFITSTHWDTDKLPMTMPDLMLSDDQTRAVTRYILSLRTR